MNYQKHFDPQLIEYFKQRDELLTTNCYKGWRSCAQGGGCARTAGLAAHRDLLP